MPDVQLEGAGQVGILSPTLDDKEGEGGGPIEVRLSDRHGDNFKIMH